MLEGTTKSCGRKPCYLLILLITLVIAGSCDRQSLPRNLLVICIDTVRADTFFSDRVHDALSARLGAAQQYRNATAPSSWTIPSVASTLTGLYPVEHNAGRFQQQPANLKSNVPGALSNSATTLAEILHEEEFATGAFSAHPWVSARFGFEQGFDQFRLHKTWQELNTDFGQWLDQTDSGRKFFAYLHFMEAHDWHIGKRAERDARLASVDPELRAQLLTDTSPAACAEQGSVICQRNQIYNLAVRELRDAIDHVLQQLEERGLLQSTLVIVYADHGEEFREHKAEHLQRDDPRKVKGLGHGHSMYQELLHVPLLVWHPGIQGSVRKDLVSLVDVVPSALRWLGVEYKGEPLPGMMLPAGTETARPDDPPRVVYASGIAYGPEQTMVREGHLKSILYYPDLHSDYFDLTHDPGEKHPLQSNPLTMRFDVLAGDYAEMKKDVFTAAPGLDPKTLEQLQSIGYLQGLEEQGASESRESEAPEQVKPSIESGDIR